MGNFDAFVDEDDDARAPPPVFVPMQASAPVPTHAPAPVPMHAPAPAPIPMGGATARAGAAFRVRAGRARDARLARRVPPMHEPQLHELKVTYMKLKVRRDITLVSVERAKVSLAQLERKPADARRERVRERTARSAATRSGERAPTRLTDPPSPSSRSSRSPNMMTIA